VPHIVSVQQPQEIGCDHGWGNIEVVNGGSVDLAAISGPIEGQTPFYKGVWGVKVSADVTRRRFSAVLIADTEWNEGRASVMLEARRCRR
jgi:hypothetical protein